MGFGCGLCFFFGLSCGIRSLTPQELFFSLSFDRITHANLFCHCMLGVTVSQLRDMSSKSDRHPLGIMIFQMVLNKWSYDLPPEDGLEFEDLLKQLKRDVKREGL